MDKEPDLVVCISEECIDAQLKPVPAVHRIHPSILQTRLSPATEPPQQ
jgi:hypothetical protein